MAFSFLILEIFTGRDILLSEKFKYFVGFLQSEYRMLAIYEGVGGSIFLEFFWRCDYRSIFAVVEGSYYPAVHMEIFFISVLTSPIIVYLLLITRAQTFYLVKSFLFYIEKLVKLDVCRFVDWVI